MKRIQTILMLLFATSACIYAHAGTTQVQVNSAILQSSGLSSQFGNAVAVDGDTVVVGAIGTVVDGRPSGAAYVFVKPSTGWTNMTQTAMLTASDSATTAYHFGASVAISGDTIVVGAPWTIVNGVVQVGAVYVYVKPPGGWTSMTETAKLTGYHVDGIGEDWIGTTVSIDGNTIVAGAPNVFPDFRALGEGEVFIYVKPPGGWKNTTENAVLYLPVGGLGFSVSTAVSGGTIVVGADGCCSEGQTVDGAAYVFLEPPGGWETTDNYTARLTGTDVGPDDAFGYAVAIDGNTVLVGSPQLWGLTVGAAYIYEEPSAGWTDMTQTAELYPLPAVEQDFGSSVAISGTNALIGAPFAELENSLGEDYLFVEPRKGWQTMSDYNATITSSGAHNFGQAVSISGGTAVTGVNGNGGVSTGEAVVSWISQ
jgi:hypothetical protein